jgi:hypothetical protein
MLRKPNANEVGVMIFRKIVRMYCFPEDVEVGKFAKIVVKKAKERMT